MAGAVIEHDLIEETKLSGSFDFRLDGPRRSLVAKGADAISLRRSGQTVRLRLELKDVPMPVLVIEA
jgi:hypothetical protein